MIRFVDPFEALVTGVTAYLAEHAVTATVTAGFKERRRQDTQGPGGANRIVFLPGDPSGKGGSLAFGVRNAGQREVLDEAGERVAVWRSFGDWERLITMAVWANDPVDRSELAQITACTKLAVWGRRAVESVGLADLRWTDVSWVVPKERTYGQEALFGLTLNMPMPDVPREVGKPGFTLRKPEQE